MGPSDSRRSAVDYHCGQWCVMAEVIGTASERPIFSRKNQICKREWSIAVHTCDVGEWGRRITGWSQPGRFSKFKTGMVGFIVETLSQYISKEENKRLKKKPTCSLWSSSVVGYNRYRNLLLLFLRCNDMVLIKNRYSICFSHNWLHFYVFFIFRVIYFFFLMRK